MTFEVIHRLIKNLRIYKVSIHIKFWYDQILKETDIQEKLIFKYKNYLRILIPVKKFQKYFWITSAWWASTVWLGLLDTALLVSQIISLWSSPTLPNRDSCNKCQATSSTTAVWPVKIVFALITLCSCKQIILLFALTIKI